jgi:hypothetical protein
MELLGRGIQRAKDIAIQVVEQGGLALTRKQVQVRGTPNHHKSGCDNDQESGILILEGERRRKPGVNSHYQCLRTPP